MAEWSKARDSKSRNPQKGFEGSNPSLSAIRLVTAFANAVTRSWSSSAFGGLRPFFQTESPRRMTLSEAPQRGVEGP